MRADRLLSLVLLLQARGRVTARELAVDLGVAVRTVYRDLAALNAAGIPVFAESGPGGGCQLIDGYSFPLRGLRPEEAEALLILGVPGALRELGLGEEFAAAHRTIGLTAGRTERPPLVHLDLPRWFRSEEPVPALRVVADALRAGRCIAFRYRRGRGTDRVGDEGRVVAPLGLVNKAGTWYLVAAKDPALTGDAAIVVFRAGRIAAARVLAEPACRPAGFDLAGFWEQWSGEFAASRPRVRVRLRAAPPALAIFPEVYGDDVRAALSAAGPPDEHGWQELTLTFEHERAAAHRLAGFGGLVQVIDPPAVRGHLVTVAHGILDRYGAADGEHTSPDEHTSPLAPS